MTGLRLCGGLIPPDEKIFGPKQMLSCFSATHAAETYQNFPNVSGGSESEDLVTYEAIENASAYFREYVASLPYVTIASLF